MIYCRISGIYMASVILADAEVLEFPAKYPCYVNGRPAVEDNGDFIYLICFHSIEWESRP